MSIIYLLIGLASGALGAMGIGGGSVSILILSGFMGVEQKTAQLINLVSFIAPAAIASFIHSKNKMIDWKCVLFTIIGGLPFAIGGAILAGALSGKTLRTIFGVFLILLGLFEFFSKMVYNKINRLRHK